MELIRKITAICMLVFMGVMFGAPVVATVTHTGVVYAQGVVPAADFTAKINSVAGTAFTSYIKPAMLVIIAIFIMVNLFQAIVQADQSKWITIISLVALASILGFATSILGALGISVTGW